MENIKLVQYGCGKMAKYIVKYAIDRGYEFVGAIDINEDIIGKDLGEVFGYDKLGVNIIHESEADKLFKEKKCDVAIITTMSLLNDIKDSTLTCIKNGVNVITTCEEAFYPFNSNPTLSIVLDKIAKEKGVTITGTGYQDAFWGNLITTICASGHKIEKIKGSSSYNVEDYGIALAKAHGAGLTHEEFEKDIASSDNISEEERNKLIVAGEFLPSYMWNVVGWLSDKLGLSVITQSQKCVPMISEKDIHSTTLDMDIKKGGVTGMSAVVTATTKEGIEFECECIGKVYNEEEFDKNVWEVLGEPNTSMVIDKPDTVALTCGAVVNRIPDLINAPVGFVPTSRMGELKYTKTK